MDSLHSQPGEHSLLKSQLPQFTENEGEASEVI